MSVAIRAVKSIQERQKDCPHNPKDVTIISNQKRCGNCMKVLGSVKN